MSGWLEAFIVIAALAIVIQMAILVAMFALMRDTVERSLRMASQLQARLDPILLRANRILEDSEERIASVMSDAAEISHVARSQAQRVDRVFSDAVERLRIQVVRADHILTGTLEVIEEAGSKVRRVWEPVRQVSAVLKGLKAGLDMIRGRREAAPDATTQDEELFI
jgi:predicted phosphoribosyltransferase